MAEESADALIKRRYGVERAEGIELSDTRGYVHLNRATISRGQNSEIDVPLWRGRLADITGWYLGRQGIGDYEGPDS